MVDFTQRKWDKEGKSSGQSAKHTYLRMTGHGGLKDTVEEDGQEKTCKPQKEMQKK